MLEKLSLFQLQEISIKNKLQKAGINQTTLKTMINIEINIYINRLDSTDYYILLNQTMNKPNYFKDFLNSSVFDGNIRLEDIIYYIQHELKERYIMGNEKYELYQLQLIEAKKAIKENERLKKSFKASQYKNTIISKNIRKLENEKKSIKLELERLQKILKNIQQLAV